MNEYTDTKLKQDDKKKKVTLDKIIGALHTRRGDNWGTAWNTDRNNMKHSGNPRGVGTDFCATTRYKHDK